MTTDAERSLDNSEYVRDVQNACLLLAYLAVVVTSVWIDPGSSEPWWRRSITSLWIDLGHSNGVTTLVSLVAFALICSVVWAELSRQRLESQNAISTPRSSTVVGILRSPDNTRSAVTRPGSVADHERVAHRRAS